MRHHGTRTKYVNEGCRCEPCCQANRDYARELQRRQRRITYGLEEPSDKWVDPTEARNHLNWLRSQGLGTRTLMRITGLGRTALVEISRGIPKRISRQTATRILSASTVHRPKSALVDARPTWKLIDDLVYLGFSKARIAHELGRKSPALQLDRHRITQRNVVQIRDLYERLIRETATWHGDYAGYAKRCCRCLRCGAAAREYQRDLRARRKSTH